MKADQQHILIKAIRQEKLSREEEVLLQEWLGEHAENQNFLTEAQGIWERSGEIMAIPSRNLDQAWQRMQDRIREEAPHPPEKRNGERLWRWLGLAAAVATLAVVGYLLTRSNAEVKWELLAEAASASQQIALPDSSQVTLFPGSKLWLAAGFAERHRKLKLEGFAFFDIAKRAELPLSVEAGAFQVQVLGTSFYWDARKQDQPQLDVIEGVVAFFPTAHPETGDTLRELESAVATPTLAIQRLGEEARLRLPPIGPASLAFAGTPLREVCAALRAHYQQPIRLASPRLENCLFSGTFDSPSLQEVLEALQFTFGEDFRFEVQEKTIVIFGSGCAQ